MSETHVKDVWLHRRAEMALDAFSPEERKGVEWALALLGDPTARDFVAANARRVPVDEPLYAFRATPDVRLFFDQAPDGTVRILDILREDKLQALRAGSPRRFRKGTSPLRLRPRVGRGKGLKAGSS